MNMKKISAAMLVGAMIAGCGDKTSSGEVTVSSGDNRIMSVNGVMLTRAELDEQVEAYVKIEREQVPANYREQFEKNLDYTRQMAKNNIGRSFIYEQVLLGKAKAEGYLVTDVDRTAAWDELKAQMPKSDEAPKSLDEMFAKAPLGVEKAREMFDRRLLIQKLLKDARAKAVTTNDYSAQAQSILARVTAEHDKAVASEADALKKIKSLEAELKKVSAEELPAKFAELAKANSDCPSGNPEKFGRTPEEKAKTPGSLGSFVRGQMVPAFSDAAFSLPVGKLSEPVKTEFGYHLILVTAKFPPVEAVGDKPAEPEKVAASHILVKCEPVRELPTKEQIVEHLKGMDSNQVLNEYVEGLVKQAKIEIFDEEFSKFKPANDESSAAGEASVETPTETAIEK